MIGIGPVYVLAGLMFAAMALMSARDSHNPRRWRNAAFWGLYAVSFLFGDLLGDMGNGILVLAMVAVAAAGLVSAARRRQRPTSAGFWRGNSAIRSSCRLWRYHW